MPRRWRLTRVIAGVSAFFCATTCALLYFSSEPSNGASENGMLHTPAKRLSSAVKYVRRVVNSSSAALTCRDADKGCAGWANSGECAKNQQFMNVSCKRSCGLCPSLLPASVSGAAQLGSARQKECDDKSSFCGQWAAVGECDSNPNYMRVNCPVTCHLCQSSRCHDDNTTRCAAEVRSGMCRAEPDRMYRECRWSCKWCAMQTSSRCLRAPGETPAASKGTLEYMFTRASTSHEYAHLKPVVHSRSPWIMSFETFLSEDETHRIIDVGGRGWQRSQAGDGVQSVRTSSTAWCDPGSCQRDPVLARVRRRIANLTLVPERNAEHLQVLKYDEGQFYRTHHDQNSGLFTPQARGLVVSLSPLTELRPLHCFIHLPCYLRTRSRACSRAAGRARLHLLHVPVHSRGGGRHALRQPRRHRARGQGQRRHVALGDRRGPQHRRAAHLPPRPAARGGHQVRCQRVGPQCADRPLPPTPATLRHRATAPLRHCATTASRRSPLAADSLAPRAVRLPDSCWQGLSTHAQEHALMRRKQTKLRPCDLCLERGLLVTFVCYHPPHFGGAVAG